MNRQRTYFANAHIRQRTNFQDSLTEEHWQSLINSYSNDEPSLLETFGRSGTLFNSECDPEFNLDFFERLKYIVTGLVRVNPADRMRLTEARKVLEELDRISKNEKYRSTKLLTLDETTQHASDFDRAEIDESSQNSYNLMDGITNHGILTFATGNEELILTQRETMLCVTMSAMYLLSFELVEFLKQLELPESRSQELVQEINKILEVPDQRESGTACFFTKLVTICCGVVSPRSLIGLNHANLDQQFQISAQEQNIRKLKLSLKIKI